MEALPTPPATPPSSASSESLFNNIQKIAASASGSQELSEHDLAAQLATLLHSKGYTKRTAELASGCNGNGTCSRVQQQKLYEKFQSTQDLRCMNVIKVSLPIAESQQPTPDGSVSEQLQLLHVGIPDAFACGTQHHDQDCLANRNYCSWSREVTDIGAQYYPRFVVNTKCHGCKAGAYACLEANGNCASIEEPITLRVLRRDTSSCNQDGSELWTETHLPESITAACNCRRMQSH